MDIPLHQDWICYLLETYSLIRRNLEANKDVLQRMKRRLKMDIDNNYRIPLVGVYNAAVFECSECGTSILNDYHKHICGIAKLVLG